MNSIVGKVKAYKTSLPALVIFVMLNACGGGGGGGGNGGNPNPVPQVLTLSLGTPSTNPAVIPPSGTPTDVTFLALVNGSAPPPSHLFLDELNDTGAVTRTGIAQLHDNGEGADVELGDRLYSTTLSLGSIEATEKHYRVRTQHNGEAVLSRTMNFWISGCPATSRPSDPQQAVFDTRSNSTIFANEVMLRTELGIAPDLDRINAIANLVGGHVVGCIPTLRQYLLDIPGDGTVEGVYTAIQTLMTHPDVAAAFPNSQTLTPAQSAVEDSLLCNGIIDTLCQWYLDRVRAQQAWQLAGGGNPQKSVAIIDFGVDCTRGGLPCDSELYNQDPIDHGTGVAGIIGSPDTASGMVGVAWNTRLYPYSFLGSAGSQYKLNELISAALSQTDVRVINISAATSTDNDGQIKQAICSAIGSGRLVVAAAGNPRGDEAQNCQQANIYPARYNAIGEQCANGADLQNGLLVVGASDINNNLASWQNGNQAQCSNRLYVDIYAPGKDIITLSTQLGYTTKSGTSFAAPLASGAASVVWGANPQLAPAQVHERLVSQASRLTLNNSNPRIQTGDTRMVDQPLLDIYRAVGGQDTIITPDTVPDDFVIAPQSNAPLHTWIISETLTISGIDSPTPINISGGYYSINDNPFTNAAGSVRNGDQVRVQLRTATTPATTRQAQLSIGGRAQTYQVTTRDPLTTPGSFEFPTQQNVMPNTPVLTSPQLITGIDAGTPISINGDNAMYAIDGGAFTNAPGTISGNQSVQVQITPSANFATTSQATLTIGTVSSTVVVTTAPADIIPNAFSLNALTNIAPNTPVTSNTITVSGINAPTVIGVSAGEYAIDNGPYTNAAGTISNGQSVQVRLTSLAGSGYTKAATLTIGGVSSVFSVTTMVLDTTPDAFSFSPQTNIAPATQVTSNTITVSGIETAVPISITGTGGANAQYAIDGNPFTATAGTINNGQSVQIQLTASAGLSTAVNATLTIGGISAVFSVATQGADTTPDNFTLVAQTDVALNTQVISNAIIITGINTATPISISGNNAQYAIDGGAFTTTAGTIDNGQSVQVRLTSSAVPGTPVSATLTVGGIANDFMVTTVPIDTTPNPFSFGAQTNIALNTQVISNAQIITGINAPTPISISGATAQYAINGGAFTNTSGNIGNGQTVQIRLTSANQPGTTTTATLTIGGIANDFTITTVPIDTTPDPFSFIAQTNIALNTQVSSNTITVNGINSPASISISGATAQYAIDGGVFTNVAGTINNNQSVQVRITSAANPNTQSIAALTIGGVTANFSVTTPSQFQVTLGAVINGSLSFVSGNGLVLSGATTQIQVSADSGYNVNGVSGCGINFDNNPTGVYTTGAITANCTVTANFVSTDIDPPILQSVSPVNLDDRVAINQPFVLNFNESIDLSSVNIGDFSLMAGTTPVAATASVADGKVLFTPNINMNFASPYTAGFNGTVSDLAGNDVVVNNSWSVTTMAAPTVISPETYAMIREYAYHQDDAGNILLVWYENAGAKWGTYYKYYNAASQTWTSTIQLDTQPLTTFKIVHDNGGMLLFFSASTIPLCSQYFNGTTFSPRICHGNIPDGAYDVASNGSGFALVWSDSVYQSTTDAYVKFYSPGSDTWSASTTIDQSPGVSASPKIVSNGTNYAAMWIVQNTDVNSVVTYDLMASVYDGVSWSSNSSLLSGNAATPMFRLVGNSTGYVMLWFAGGHIFANVYNGTSNITQIDNPLDSVVSQPVLASAADSFAAGWVDSNGNLISNVYKSGAWSGPVTMVAASSNGLMLNSGVNSFLFTFIDSAGQLNALRYDGSVWESVATLLGASNNYRSVNSVGEQFAVLWTHSNAGVVGTYANIYSGGWGASTRLDTNSFPAAGYKSYSYNSPKISIRNNDAVAIWLENNGTGVAFNLSRIIFSSGIWNSESGSPFLPSRGDATGAKFATNNAGVTVAVWKQADSDDGKVFYSIKNGATWSSAVTIPECGQVVYGYSVVSNGDTFMISCNPYAGTGGFSWSAQISFTLTGTTLGPAQTIFANASSVRRDNCVVSNGTDYAAVLPTQSNEILVNVFDSVAGNWTGEQVIATVGYGGYAPVYIASNGSGFAATWWSGVGFNPPFDLFASTYESGIWNTPVQVNTITKDWYPNGVSHSVVSNGTDYLLSWFSDSGINSSRYSTLSGTWSSEFVVFPKNYGGNISDGMQSSMLGSGQGTILTETSSVSASVFDGNTWVTSELVGNINSPFSPQITTNQSGYAAVWTHKLSTISNPNAYMARYENGAWTTPLLLENSDASAYEVMLIPVGTKYRAIWTQSDINFTSDPNARRVWVSGDF